MMKAVAALMLMTAVVFAAGCTKPDDPNNGNNGGNNGNNGNNGGSTYNGHEYVDLGLPSGTLWATCNVGADTPEGYGDYYAWGETTTKNTYGWNNYKWCSGIGKLTKYCQNASFGFNGFTDNLTVLQPSDDAATANWGSGWCTPSDAQLTELYENTNHAWTHQTGVNGRLFTASNGKSLFLPAAGYTVGSDLRYDGSFGHYWSRSVKTTGDPGGGWSLKFGSGECDLNVHSRSNGLAVRPVREN